MSEQCKMIYTDLVLSPIENSTNNSNNDKEVSDFIISTEEKKDMPIETLRIDDLIKETDNIPFPSPKNSDNRNYENIHYIPYNRLSTLNPDGINEFFFEEEERNGVNIIFKEGTNIIQSISIDLFIKKIILENFSQEQPKIVKSFLNQFCSFFKYHILIDKILNAFYFYEEQSIEADKLNNLIVFLNSAVIEIYEENRTSTDSITEISHKLVDFYNRLINKGIYNTTGVKQILGLIEQTNPSSYDVEFTKLSLIPRKKSQNVIIKRSCSTQGARRKKTLVMKKPYFSVLDYEPIEIANQLTFLSSIQLTLISNREFLAARFLKKDKAITSPNIVKITQRFDSLVFFIIEDILSYDHKAVRGKVIDKWITIAMKCKEMNNFNDSMAIKSALNHFIIAKLKLSWKYVKKSSIRHLESLNSFFSCDGNYKNLRDEINSISNQPYVPYLGLLMRDVAFYEEKGKYITNNNTMINIEKILTIQNLLDKFYKFKHNAYNIKQIDSLSFFSCPITKNEEELELLGDQIEPIFTLKDKKEEEKRLTAIDKMFFCIDERSTEQRRVRHQNKFLTNTNLIRSNI